MAEEKVLKQKLLMKKNIEVLEEEELHTEDIFSIVLCQALLKGEKNGPDYSKSNRNGSKKNNSIRK